VVLAGPAFATLTVAIDGLWISLMQHDRRTHRALFNVAEPAVSLTAEEPATGCKSVSGQPTAGQLGAVAGMTSLIAAGMAMAATLVDDSCDCARTNDWG